MVNYKKRFSIVFTSSTATEERDGSLMRNIAVYFSLYLKSVPDETLSTTGNFFKQLWLHCKNVETNEFDKLHRIVRKKTRIVYRINTDKNVMTSCGAFMREPRPFSFPSIFLNKNWPVILRAEVSIHSFEGVGGGKEKDNLRSTATSLASSLWIFWSIPDMSSYRLDKLRRAYPPADSNIQWRLT